MRYRLLQLTVTLVSLMYSTDEGDVILTEIGECEGVDAVAIRYERTPAQVGVVKPVPAPEWYQIDK